MKPEYPAILRATLWSAYGDALGFISELTDERGLLRRARTQRLASTVEWVRRIGGEFGADIAFPAGTYSDDTQLRLATFRAIRANGVFDVEAFAKIELTVWPSYALGAGRGTKAAAASLAADDVNWYSNFFDRPEQGRYIDVGGNGAAMRVQPHVWASCDPSKSSTWIRDVLRNAICTHGHPRGFLGAIFHARCLAYTIVENKIPSISLWREFAQDFLDIPSVVAADQELSAFWAPTWEAKNGRSLMDSCKITYREFLDDVETICAQGGPDKEATYRNVLHVLDGFDPRRRGDGLRTALFAVFLADLFNAENDPAQALETAANCIGSDTDTIATMTGALLGQLSTKSPTAPLLDLPYLTESARLIHNTAIGTRDESFNYPDLMRWTPPKTQQDAVVISHGQYHIRGLGGVAEAGAEFKPRRNQSAIWQMMVLDFGQTFFIKRRAELSDVSSAITPHPPTEVKPSRLSNAEQVDFFHPAKIIAEPEAQRMEVGTLDDMTTEAIVSNFDPSLIGKHILWLADGQNGIERVIAYSAIIAKARRARLKREHRRQ